MNALAPEFMQTRTGYVCDVPVSYDAQGEMWIRDCGHCARCVARKKRDVAGRCAAEAYTSAEVVVWTLTYKPGEPGALEFVTEDRQRFLKRVRDWLVREARRKVGAPKRSPKGAAAHVRAYWKHRVSEVLPAVRYMGCGERGQRNTKRCHWHLVLFMSKPSGFVSTPKESDGKPGREEHPLWNHGVVNVHVLDRDIEPKMRAVRYAVKYLNKAKPPSKRARFNGEKPEAMFFRSTATPLGFEWLTDLARQSAQAGLPVDGSYRVPGVYFSRGRVKRDKRSGEMRVMPIEQVKHVLTGRMRDHYIAAYREEWARIRPSHDVPMTPFLLRFDPEAEMRISDHTRANPMEWKPRGQRAKPLAVPKRDCSGFLAVNVPGRGCAGLVQVYRSGYAQFVDPDGVKHPVPHGNIRDLVRMDDAAHGRVEQWIADRRGPDWVSGREMRLRKLQRQLAQRDAHLSYAKKGPKITAAHLPGYEPMTALRRKLLMNGNAHIPGTVVRSGPASPCFVRPVTRLRKPISQREC